MKKKKLAPKRSKSSKKSSKKNFLLPIIITILVLCTVLAVFLSQQQTRLNSQASNAVPAYCEEITKHVGIAQGTELASMAAMTVRQDNVVLDGQEITGDVTVYGNNFTIKNSRITEGSLILRNNSDILVENSKIGGISISGAKNVTIRGSDIGGNRNGRGIYIAAGTNEERPQNILIENSWVHEQNITSVDGQKGGSYYAVHVRGVENLTLRNNYFDATPFIHLPEGGGTVAAIALQNANGGNDNVTIDGNCIDGGGFMFYFGAHNLTVTNNKIGRPHYTLLYPTFTAFTQSGNTWMKSGNPMEIILGLKEEAATPAPTEVIATVAPTDLPASTSQKYGPNGTAWASNTPDANAAPTKVLNSYAELVTALRTANSGDVFHLKSMTIPANTRLNDATANARLATLGTNVLVRPAPGERVIVGSGFKVLVPRVTWAYLQVEGSFHFESGAHRARLARTKLVGASSIHATNNVSDIEFVEVVGIDRAVGKDRVDVGSYQSPNAPQNVSFIRCWLEGITPAAGSHSDTMQWIAGTGTMTLRNTYVGPAGNNATMQMGREQQPADMPYANFVLDTVFLGGAEVYGNGNQLYKLSSATPNNSYRNVEWYGNFSTYQRNNMVLPTVMENNRIAVADPILAECTDATCSTSARTKTRHVKDLYPNNEYGASITKPTFVPPSWWW